MRKVWSFFFPVFFLVIFLGFYLQVQQAQENQFQRLAIPSEFPRPRKIVPKTRSSQIKDIQVFGERFGIAYTDDTLYRTDDKGITWREIAVPRKFDEVISGALFSNKTDSLVILANYQTARLVIAKTKDGGESWTRQIINLQLADLEEANLQKISFGFENEKGWLRIDLGSSANFERYIYYFTNNVGETWERGNEVNEKRIYERNFDSLKQFGDYFKNSDNIQVKKFDSTTESIVINTTPSIETGLIERHSDWLLTSEGNCRANKIGCVQITRIYKIVTTFENGKTNLSIEEITPPQIKELSRIEKEQAKLEAENSVFAAPMAFRDLKRSI